MSTQKGETQIIRPSPITSRTVVGIPKIITQPEGQGLEFKAHLPSQTDLANHIAAFSNTQGGTIIIGAEAGGKRIAGLKNTDILPKYVASVLQRISPTVNATAESWIVNGKPILVIQVPKGNETPYISTGAILERRGVNLTPLTASALYSGIVSRSTTLKDLRAEIKRLSVKVTTLNNQLIERGSWKSRMPDIAIGSGIGAAISLGITFGLQYLNIISGNG